MRRALVVGCGYGDDAEWLAAQGCEVTAFDISPSAIAHCRARFPGSPVRYQAADLLSPPGEWLESRSASIFEAYTVQVLPPGSAERATAIRMLAALTGGTLLIVARGREEGDDPGVMPWPLLRAELDPLREAGLREVAFEEYRDGEDPPVAPLSGHLPALTGPASPPRCRRGHRTDAATAQPSLTPSAREQHQPVSSISP